MVVPFGGNVAELFRHRSLACGLSPLQPAPAKGYSLSSSPQSFLRICVLVLPEEHLGKGPAFATSACFEHFSRGSGRPCLGRGEAFFEVTTLGTSSDRQLRGQSLPVSAALRLASFAGAASGLGVERD